MFTFTSSDSSSMTRTALGEDLRTFIQVKKEVGSIFLFALKVQSRTLAPECTPKGTPIGSVEGGKFLESGSEVPGIPPKGKGSVDELTESGSKVLLFLESGSRVLGAISSGMLFTW